MNETLPHLPVAWQGLAPDQSVFSGNHKEKESIGKFMRKSMNAFDSSSSKLAFLEGRYLYGYDR